MTALRITELNLTGNPIDNLKVCVEALKGMPLLSSLYIDLHEEGHVDFLLRSIPFLQQLNGIAVVKAEDSALPPSTGKDSESFYQTHSSHVSEIELRSETR